MDTVVLLSETGELQLTSLSRHALYHAVSVLLPNSQSMTAILPKSGSRKVENFCSDLPQAISSKIRRKSSTLSKTDDGNPLIPSLEIHKFLEHAITVEKFTKALEARLLDLSGGEIDMDKLHEICWNVYESEKGQEVSIRHWFSPTCTYRMWLVFCCVQEQTLSDMLSAVTANEVIKRLGELCGYKWNEAYSYVDSTDLTFPTYLKAIATYFTKLQLEMSLTCEVIGDMVDEIVHGVLKKGVLTKKGHKRKNYKRRWFVLQRTIIRYYENRGNMVLKGQLVLNSKTSVMSLPDRGKRKCLFEVTCGHTGTPFEISADDQRTKHEWILAIKKAIALAKVLDGSSKQEDFSDDLSGFYLLKYGTPQPYLMRQDSTVRSMKYHALFKDQRKRLSGKKKDATEDRTRSNSDESTSSLASIPQEDYMPMNPLQKDLQVYSEESSDDEDNYTMMEPLKEQTSSSLSKSSDCIFDSTSQGDSKRNSRELKKSISAHMQIQLNSDLSEDKSSLKEDEEDDGCYEEADFPQATWSPRSMDKELWTPRSMDKELGGYIDVKHMKKTQLSNSLDSKMSSKIFEDGGIPGKESSKILSLERVPEDDDRGPSPHSYLTIVRGENSPDVSTKRSQTMVPSSSKVSPIHSHSSSLSSHEKSDAPPPVQPRPMTSTLSSRPTSKISSSSTMDSRQNLPPLPPR